MSLNPMPSASRPQMRVEALDLLRLFAALSVVLYHYGFRGAAADDMTRMAIPALIPIVKYSSLGVQLFFVISGFVVAFSADRRSVRDFVIARASRIYPGFLICMTLTCLVTLAWGPPRFETSPTQWAANLVILAPALGQPFMDGVYWSITYELVFYGWIAVLLGTSLFPRRLPEVAVLWMALSLVNEIALDSGALRFLLLTNYSGFFCAGLMLFCLRQGRSGVATWALLAAATALAVWQAELDAIWSRGHYHIELSSAIVADCAVAAVALVGCCLFIRRVPLPAGLVLALGGLTYPFYLLHQHAGFILANKLEGVAPAPVLAAGLIAGFGLLSWAIWRFAERPAQRWLKSGLSGLAGVLPLGPLARASGPRRA